LLETKGKPTYSFSMQQFPTITSLGLPPEKHADRIVAEMLRIIAAKRAECWPKLHAVLDGAVAQIAKTYILERGYDEQPVRDGEQLRVKLPYDMGTAVCVLTQHEDGAGGVVVATLWKEGEEAGTLAVAPTV
jgi:hypothetical protein